MRDSVWIICLIMAAAALVLWWKDRSSNRHLILCMRRMRGSRFYAALYPTVEKMRSMDIDEVRVERNRVTFFSIYPPGKVAEFTMDTRGFGSLDNEHAYALAQVLAMDLPQLQSGRDYDFRCYKTMRPNGTKDDTYVFTAKKHYKQSVLAAHRQMNYDRLY